MTTKKRYDLLIFGATGFTGRQTLNYLLADPARTAPLKRWAIAGRDLSRLKSLIAGLPEGVAAPECLVVDLADSDSVTAAISNSRVLLHLAGPYSDQGDSVVKACIDHGCHYLDLTGETFWIRGLIAEHHAAAEAAKVKIVPCCGFEALPFDIGTLLAAQNFKGECDSVKAIVSMTGGGMSSPKDGLSGGTASTFRVLLRNDHTDSLHDPACLVEPELLAKAYRKRNHINLSTRYDADMQAWTGPSVPGPFINPPIVLRSAALAEALGNGYGYGKRFRYEEALNMASVLPRLFNNSLTQRASGLMMTAAYTSLSALFASKLPRTRRVTEAVMAAVSPKSGEGPSLKALDRIGYVIDFFAEGVVNKKPRRVHVRLVAAGHPGYRSTANLVAEAALALACDSRKLPKHYGIITPAHAFGTALLPRLERAGLVFTQVA
jgi:short subunit dehydrogenase-like uncharacterized protein